MAFRARSVALFRWGHGPRSGMLCKGRGLATVSDGARYVFSPQFYVIVLIFRALDRMMLSLSEVAMQAPKHALPLPVPVLEPHWSPPRSRTSASARAILVSEELGRAQ